LSPDALPAVTVPRPSVRNAGLSFDSVSSVVSGRRNSSSATSAVPFRPAGTSTGAISSANTPAARAAAAFCCDRQANRSWSARGMPNRSATFSAVSPMASVPYCSRMRGLTKRQPSDVSWSCTSRPYGLPDFDITNGARVMLSTPPATYTSPSPAITARAAWRRAHPRGAAGG
jgi:hypothetical protein